MSEDAEVLADAYGEILMNTHLKVLIDIQDKSRIKIESLIFRTSKAKIIRLKVWSSDGKWTKNFLWGFNHNNDENANDDDTSDGYDGDDDDDDDDEDSDNTCVSRSGQQPRHWSWDVGVWHSGSPWQNGEHLATSQNYSADEDGKRENGLDMSTSWLFNYERAGED